MPHSKAQIDDNDSSARQPGNLQNQSIKKPGRPYTGKENVPPADLNGTLSAIMERPACPPIASLYTLLQPSQKLSGSSSRLQEQAMHSVKVSSQGYGRQMGSTETGQPSKLLPSWQNTRKGAQSSQVGALMGLSSKEKGRLDGPALMPRQHSQRPAREESKTTSKLSSVGPSLVEENCSIRMVAKNDSTPKANIQRTCTSKFQCETPQAATTDLEPSFDISQMETESEMRRKIQVRMRRHHAKRAKLRN